MSCVRITVYRHGHEYFASRTFPRPNVPSNITFSNVLFTMEQQVADIDTLKTFEDSVRQKCRRLGISKVINLDS